MAEPRCPTLTARPLWSLTEDVLLLNVGDGLVARTRWGDIHIDDGSAVVRESLHRMTLGPVTLGNVAGLREDYLRWRAGSQETSPAWRRVQRVIEQLGGCVIASLELGDGAGPDISVVPVSAHAAFSIPPVTETSLVTLVPGCRLESLGGLHTLSAPSALHQVELRPPAVNVVRRLAGGPHLLKDVAAAVRLNVRLTVDVVAYLAGAGMVTVAERSGPASPAL
ncbi:MULTISPECIES: hypothetical protein [Thermomonospora]|uniref:Uncharacterized protein n=1 Tax=Thermomonospora curvata (strain ATCC 19995 / DSM 43183 / JCM 3096 / KCTC 9072 / NBRC 15933 / NCIMB 10081 / Henssen B9) TaxID=471852 RepID=D1A619_THECD|nr:MULTISPECIES: hypothetical protein [Thermomonospora]ACY98314.1 hypothetical protein Tcur_2768 [Thermomonospora curvata DSM 43183]PKK13480.1 MAG: hypothetical protein BUE48_013465 [Thermomonospora sp. CIF 1]